jgi:hypothetical protein
VLVRDHVERAVGRLELPNGRTYKEETPGADADPDENHHYSHDADELDPSRRFLCHRQLPP